MAIPYFGILGGLLMLIIGSVKSPALRANRRLPLWRARDGYGRLALVGLSLFTLTVVIRAIAHIAT
jgi:hypothetical protein